MECFGLGEKADNFKEWRMSAIILTEHFLRAHNNFGDYERTSESVP
jgi:hypothetical protein